MGIVENSFLLANAIVPFHTIVKREKWVFVYQKNVALIIVS